MPTDPAATPVTPVPAAPKLIPPDFELPANVASQRDHYLRDIDWLRDYRPGKVSYVESPERRLGCFDRPGFRFTLLELAGAGSIRHLWCTFQPGQGEHRVDIYLDGATSPTLSGTMTQLIDRAVAAGAVPVPGFVGRNYAFNLFTPIPFTTGARIVIETIDPVWILFYQIDYRTEVRSAPADTRPPTRPGLLREGRARVTIPPGEIATVVAAAGPAVLRRWTLQTSLPVAGHRQLDLRIRYDGCPRDAVAATLADFFGPFRSVALDTDPQTGARTCHLPAPFGKSVQIRLHNRSGQPVTVDAAYALEALPGWSGERGYFHALGQTTAPTPGYRQHQVAYLRGRGHWLGMALYNTGHDHGGGDFAVIDGEGERPAFLHGINGEDYFTFAWFGQGGNHPFAVAHRNPEGRIRLHFENPYPFRQSFSLYWGTYPNLTTRSVAYWYQDSPDDTTVPDGENPLNVEWDCFGPVPLPLDAEHRIAGDFTDALPSVAELDAGKTFPCRMVEETFVRGWAKQLSIGPMVELTYLGRHGTRVKVESELGGMGHAYLARRKVDSATARRATVHFSHDDPIRVLVNSREVYRGGTHAGFATVTFPVEYLAGRNEVVVQLVNQYNVNFNWAGFCWRESES